MKLRRLVLFVIGGMTFGALLSADTIIRSGSVTGGKLILSGKTLNYPVLKASGMKSIRKGLIDFKTIQLAQIQPTVRYSKSPVLLNRRMTVSLPETRKSTLGNERFDVRRTAPQAQKTNAKLHVFAVSPIISTSDQ